MLDNLDQFEIDGSKLQRMRKDKKLTQKQVAEAVGVQTVTVSSYERKGGGKPSGDILARLMILYGVRSPETVVSLRS
jgi:transcriptional regulator with XRE-family HTH domain